MVTYRKPSFYHCLKYGMAALTILFAPTLSANVDPDNYTDLPDVPTNQLIIKYKTQSKVYSQATRVDQMQRINQRVGLQMKYLRPMSGNAHVLLLPKNMSTQQAQIISQELMNLPEVEYAQPDSRKFPMVVPNDPLYKEQWSLSDIYGINLPAAWDLSKGYSTVVVAVIDTGYTNHADLAGKFLPGYDFIHHSLVGNDGDGRDNSALDTGDWLSEEDIATDGLYKGCSVSPRNSSWHGTHVAGTVAALTNNGMGVSGVNWKSKILPVRVLGKCGGFTSDITDGMRWAAGLPVDGVPNNPNPAKVLNLSLGGGGACSPAEQDAIDAIYAKGVIIVVAAGNSNMDAGNFSPASCNKIITVAATGRDGMRAYYSNFGAVVDIAAPGGAQSFKNDPQGILSTLNTGLTSPVTSPDGDTFINYQGTSMAAPHVAGIVSLLVSRNPNLTYAQVLQLLQSKAKGFAPESDCTLVKCGSGIANTQASLAAVPPAITTTTSVAANDGMVLETSENGNVGGSIYTSSSIFYLGDDASDRQYRAILSFNTAGLPNDAVITKATLKIRSSTLAGSNPFTTHGPLLADIKKLYFGTAVGVQAEDFQAAANLSGAGSFGSTPGSGGWYSTNIKTTGLQFINKAGTTQFRLRFNKDDNDDRGADYMKFYTGEVSTSSRPQLIIQYFRP